MTRKQAVKKLDEAFSKYIRLRNADAHGTTECWTCGKKDHWKKLQAGHFQSRKHYSTRWNETNVQVQCVGCNVYRYGEQYKFGSLLDIKYGKGTADKLYQKAKGVVKLSTQDLEFLIKYYKEKVAELEKRY